MFPSYFAIGDVWNEFLFLLSELHGIDEGNLSLFIIKLLQKNFLRPERLLIFI